MSQSTLQISCRIGTTDALAKLGLEIRMDNQVVFDTDHVAESHTFTYSMPDDEADHCLEFVMKNKTAEHTRVDAEGSIINDACLTVTDVTFDDIELKQIFIDQAVYHHDFNGTQTPVEDKFYGTMGCNGSVKLNFSTPMYLWLLENM